MSILFFLIGLSFIIFDAWTSRDFDRYPALSEGTKIFRDAAGEFSINKYAEVHSVVIGITVAIYWEVRSNPTAVDWAIIIPIMFALFNAAHLFRGLKNMKDKAYEREQGRFW